MHRSSRSITRLATGVVTAVLLSAPLAAHHSFAMYDMQTTRVFTGVVTRVDPAANHMLLFFAPMNAARKNVERDQKGEPVVWTIEMAGSTQMARRGVTVNSFPPGTIFSVGLHPLRSGKPAGVMEGGLFKCPEKTPPAPGRHCDSVKGHTAIGSEPLPTPTK
jgi:hypothetical protein